MHVFTSFSMGNFPILTLLHIALILSTVSASHFRGGTISWKHLGRSGNVHDVMITYSFGRVGVGTCPDNLIRNRAIGFGIGGWKNFGLQAYSSTNETIQVICTANDRGGNWEYGSNSFVARVTTSGPFYISNTGGNRLTTIWASAGSWALTTSFIDIGVRSDTGLVNNPPTALSSPVVKLIQGCAQVIAIKNRDVDDDTVTCRYAVSGKSPDECDQACNGPSSKGYSHFTLNETACTISYDGGGATAVVAVSLVLSDHPKTNILLDGARSFSTSDFLSDVPLQFIMKIESANGSCNEIPTYPEKNIQNGEEIIISAHGMMNRTMFAYSSHPSIAITQLVVLGPVGLIVDGVQSLGNNLYSANIYWHPGVKQIGAHDVCYYASDSAGRVGRSICFSFVVSGEAPCAINNGGCSDICEVSGLYTACHCSYPCWILDVDGVTCVPNATTITCVREQMALAVPKCAANGTVVVGTSLSDISQEQCQSTQVNNQHILNINASTCGLRYEVSPYQIQFVGNMWIWYGTNPQSSLITRGEYRSVPVRCTLSLSKEVSANFVPELPFDNESFPVDVNLEGFGAYSFFFEFYRTVEYTSVVSPHEYPISVTVNDRFYFSIGAIGQPGFIFSTRECKATTSAADPTQSPLSYIFLQDGCSRDATLRRVPSDNPMEERFSMKAFDFGEKITSSRDTADISLQCKVMLCDSRNFTSRCHRGCIPSTRKKRSALESFDIDDDDHENPSPLHSAYSESPLQNVRGRFILVADPEASDGLPPSESPHRLYYVLIAIGLVLVAIVLFVSYRILQSRQIPSSTISTNTPDCGYEEGNLLGRQLESQFSNTQ